MPIVVSTLSADNHYMDWDRKTGPESKAGQLAVAKRGVLVKGGANVAGRLQTPLGVPTSVTDDEAQFLSAHPNFQFHEKGGFVKILETSAPALSVQDAEEVAKKDMTDRDDSAPLNETKGDFEEGGRAAGVAPANAKIE